MTDIAYIGLGSNLGESLDTFDRAIDAIDNLKYCAVINRSSNYASKPMGPQDQPDYVNAVIAVETQLSPHDLLHGLQQIELSHGRVRKSERWGPRTLDLDILLFGDQTISTSDLVVPHYGLPQREFVLVPLFEIVPSMIMPDGQPISQWVSRCTLDGLRRLRPSNQD